MPEDLKDYKPAKKFKDCLFPVTRAIFEAANHADLSKLFSRMNILVVGKPSINPMPRVSDFVLDQLHLYIDCINQYEVEGNVFCAIANNIRV